jgi:hypothetical protein
MAAQRQTTASEKKRLSPTSSSLQQASPALDGATLHRAINSPGSLSSVAAAQALQRTIGNQAVQRMIQREQAVGSDEQQRVQRQLPLPRSSFGGDKVVQRMQLVATDKGLVEKDFIVLNNIKFGLEHNQARGVANEKIESIFGDYSAKDIDFDKDEIIFLHGHGLSGMFEHTLKTADKNHPQLWDSDDKEGFLAFDTAAEIVVNKLKQDAPSGKSIELRSVSCYGASENQAPKYESLVTSLEKQLAIHGLEGSAYGCLNLAVSCPGMEDTYQVDPTKSGFSTMTDKYLKEPKVQFATWLESPEGETAGYAERLNYIKRWEPDFQALVKEALESGLLYTPQKDKEQYITKVVGKKVMRL